jgi:hypothetical protein
MDKNLDLRHIGNLMGVPLYVDVSQVPDVQISEFPTKYTERDKKVMMIRLMFQQFFAPPPPTSSFGSSRVKKAKSDE